MSNSRLSTLNIRDAHISERINLSFTDTTCKYTLEETEATELRGVNFAIGVLPDKPGPKNDLTMGLWNRSPADPATLKVGEIKSRSRRFLNAGDGKCTDRNASFNVVEGTHRSIFIQHPRWGQALPRTKTPQ